MLLKWEYRIIYIFLTLHADYNEVYACYAVKVLKNKPLKNFKQGGARPVRRRLIRRCWTIAFIDCSRVFTTLVLTQEEIINVFLLFGYFVMSLVSFFLGQDKKIKTFINMYQNL